VSERVLRHSKWDALLIALSFAHGGVLFAVPSIPVIALGLWWNSNTVSHNFIHLPFFRSAAGNRLYSLYLTLLLGFPQSLWRERHLAHHSGNASRIRMTPAIAIETSLVFCLWAVLLTRSPQFFISIYLPGYAAGLTLCYIHGYFEHAHGTKSNYGFMYNAPFFNDGYHVEHHRKPTEHWTRLPGNVIGGANTSRWPAVLRWIETVNLETLEHFVLRSRLLQNILLRTHEQALRRLLPRLPQVRTVKIVGGGLFPRTAILLDKMLPGAEITIIDANAANIQAAKVFLSSRTKLVHDWFDSTYSTGADLIVIPLSFMGDRAALYKNPPGPAVLIHDWIWAKRAEGVVVSPWLLKRLNLIQR
jgi:hypothetical protein